MLLVCTDLPPGTIEIAIPRAIHRMLTRENFDAVPGGAGFLCVSAIRRFRRLRHREGDTTHAWLGYPKSFENNLPITPIICRLCVKPCGTLTGGERLASRRALTSPVSLSIKGSKPYEVRRGTLAPLMHASIAAAQTSKTAAKFRLKKQRPAVRKKAKLAPPCTKLPSGGSRGSRLSV